MKTFHRGPFMKEATLSLSGSQKSLLSHGMGCKEGGWGSLLYTYSLFQTTGRKQVCLTMGQVHWKSQA